MSVQTSYGFDTQWGIAGGIYDLAPYAIDTFLNEEEHGVLKCGLGVVTGEDAGTCIRLPETADAEETGKFEGIVVNNHTREYDLEGKVYLRHGVSVGVMRYGRVWARTAKEDNLQENKVAYGDPLYICLTEGDEGTVTNKAESNLAVSGRFLSGIDNGLALVELFNPNFVPKENP